MDDINNMTGRSEKGTLTDKRLGKWVRNERDGG